ncbi:MAG: filamentous hemagglutinin N-terminal domain-containing protein [Gammaproteobacteria bacterium]
MSRVRRVGWWLAIVSSVSHAEVTLDGSMGPAGPLPGPEFQVEARFGRLVGTNLFHSFEEFRLNSAQTATFNDSGAMGSIENILGRVTGPTVSEIDGAIRTRFQNSAPNLFLLNPAGLTFGPNATLDVQGSFHASTADSIKLGDGIQFDAVPTANDALLTTAPPRAFGFLPSDQSEQRPITVSGSKLGVPTGESLSFVGKGDPRVFPFGSIAQIGAVHVESGVLDAPGGQVDVVQARSNSEVLIKRPIRLYPQMDRKIRFVLLISTSWKTSLSTPERSR